MECVQSQMEPVYNFLVENVLGGINEPWLNIGLRNFTNIELIEKIEKYPLLENEHIDLKQRTYDYHLGRIKFFMNELCIKNILDPIHMDGGELRDGNHRLITSIIMNKKYIRSTYEAGASKKVLNWLKDGLV